ncbi:hypothetical protein BSKO_14043 [Bryopsis sp. KO-2023]|nr:hypothetical protein BSKO_14043 [Bryopsis sp. KO-2023]
MSQFLTWADIKKDHLQTLRTAEENGKEPRDVLAYVLELSDLNDARNSIELDLYVFTFKFAQEAGFEDDQLSCLISIVKDVHKASVKRRLTIDESFTLFKQTLLLHSVQRPPFSVGVFCVKLVARITEWMLDTYYRHYKLYQYAFTDRVTMNVTSRHVKEVVETPPSLPPLAEAMTEEEHNEIVEQKRKEKEEEDRVAAEEREKEEEAQRQLKLKEEYERAIPDEIQTRVRIVVKKEMELLRTTMEKQFEEQRASLQARIDTLEGTATNAENS